MGSQTLACLVRLKRNFLLLGCTLRIGTMEDWFPEATWQYSSNLRQNHYRPLCFDDEPS